MNHAWRRRRVTAGLVAAALVLTGCWGDDDDDGSPSDTTDPTSNTLAPGDDRPIVTVGGVDAASLDTGGLLGIRLSEGEAYLAPIERSDVVEGTPLTDAEVDALIGRLPAWDIPPTDQVEFNRPAESLLPPTVAETVAGSFPPAVDDVDPVDVPPDGPLEVLRYQPEGAVDVAPFLAVTFSEPMVPLATLEQLDDADVPVRVTPAIEGRWRWIGTRTLRFELVPGLIDRLPASTRYEVEVPAGTESANGAVLDESVTWSFTTPTPSVTSIAGVSDSMPVGPVWVATFDQRVDADAVVAAITVTAGGRDVPVRVATDSEIEDVDHARRAVEAALDDRAVAFTPTVELPVDTAVEIAIGPDVPSAEGPLTSPTVDRYSGRTFGALRIIDSWCSWGDDCEPGSSLVIEFSNPLDTDGLDADTVADLISVEPAIAGLRIDVFGSRVELRGATKGRTTYEVTLGGDLRDVYGQTLGDDRTVSFDVGPARPALRGLLREFITTDPSADRPSVSILTINHDAVRVRAWAITPDRLREFREYLEETWRDADAEVPEWQIVLDDEIEIDAERDTYTETAVDLSTAFNLAGSQIVVRIDSLLDLSENDDDYWRNRPTVAWVQNTTLGIDAIFDSERLVIATNDLTTGEPVEGIPVELLGDGRVATTDEHGLAELDLGTKGVLGLFANAGDRSALLPADWWDGWRERDERNDEARWYVFDDRGIYRPGETVRLTGWVRRFDWTDDQQLALYDPDTSLRYRAWDAQGAELAAGNVALRALGGFDLEINLPAGANLGTAWVEFEVVGEAGWTGHSHSFQVQEFRRPEFEVDARQESPAPHYAAEPATVAVEAEYFAGGPLPDADVEWLVSSRETTYEPPNWDEFRFGVWQPWWYWGGDVEVAADVAFAVDECFDCGPGFSTTYEQFAGRTDATGTHYLRMDFSGDGVDLPNTVTAEATVFDVDRQAWADRTDLLVHPARVYVGLRTDRNFVREGTPIRVDAVVTDIDGRPVAGRDVSIVAGRLDWAYEGGRWVEVVVDESTCDLLSTTSVETGTMRCEFPTEVGGRYRITAIVTDEFGDVNRTEITQWVSGGQGRPVRNVEQETVTIVPDRETYEPGDVAELLVQAPFAPAYGVVTVIHHDIETVESFEAEDGSAVIEIPIEDGYVPNVTVRVDMNGSATRYDDDGNVRTDIPPRPAFAVGTIDLRVPPVTRELAVTAVPADTGLEPGDDTTVTVEVRDPDGEPVVGADVAIVVVDEAVLSLTGYELADPLDAFYRDVWPNVESQHLRSSLLLASADDLAAGGEDGGVVAPTSASVDDADFALEESADEAAGERAGDTAVDDPIELRTDFDPLAVYEPAESTGPDGSVTVDVPLPDTLTRYRVMAVAVDGAERFGTGESTITARLPLMVRASAPRFANYGDRFELPVVLQNQTDDDLEVDVAVQVANLELLGAAGRRVTVPANNRIEVRFPTGTDSAGTARLRVVAASGSFSDAAEFELPVYTPSTKEAFATYGVIDEGAISQPILPPENVIGEFGGLQIGTSSTALQALTDAVLYLHEYRYSSSDGYASRLMAVAALRDVLDAFDAEGLPDAAELDARVADDIAGLVALQNGDGGFPYWQRGRESIPWQSIQATHALVVARDAGYSVPSAAISDALRFIADIESHIPSYYSERVKLTLRAYAVYVRGEAGVPDNGEALAVYRDADGALEPDALAWVWPSIVDPRVRDEIERTIQNAAVETAGAAAFATGYTENAYVIAQSDRRVDGVVLDALLTQTPETDLIPKVVNGLLGHRRDGRWNNAHENAFILLALHRYFETFESVDPVFVARAWLGDEYVAEVDFAGRTTDRVNTTIPTTVLLELLDGTADEPLTAESVPLVIAKDGEGRLYYRLGLTYAPSDLRLDARDEGFVVERTYEAVDDPDDVRRDGDGNWTIRAGATVRVRLTMVADAPRAHVALSDPLPAGLEPINPALAVSQTIPPDADGPGDIEPLWWWRWFGHQNLRDDRAEAFAEYVYGGTYEYSYLARATTPGTFVVPPATAEEIYSPEVFGRTSTAVVVIE